MPNFKLRYEDSEDMETLLADTVIFKLHNYKLNRERFLGHPIGFLIQIVIILQGYFQYSSKIQINQMAIFRS